MSYIPLTLNTKESDTRRVYKYRLPLKGVSFSMNESDFEEGKCRYIENFDINTNSISSVCAGQRVFDDFAPGKTLYSITKEGFCGKIIIHAGNCLYMFDEASESPEIISDILPDSKSIFVEFLSKLYIYCERRVFSLDNSFSFTEEECEPAVLFQDVDPSTPNFSKSFVKDAPINLIAPRISVEYAAEGINVHVSSYELPYECDTERNIEVTVGGVLCPAERYEVKSKKIVFNDYGETYMKSVTICYYVKNGGDIGYEDVLYGCSKCEVFGGNNLSGTRIFMTGNPEKKGVYYKSGLLNPLHFSAADYEIVGDGCDNVTGLIKMYDYMIIFTERAVHRMSYVYNDTEPYFTIEMLSNEAGCDMPDSIQLVDNRVVFANSEKGIFILDSANEAGEHNIKPISKNIEKNGRTGFFDCEKNDLLGGCSVDFDRKYILCVKNKAFIWDYGKSPYSSLSNYSKAQAGLIFNLRTFDETDIFLNLKGKLYGVSKNDICITGYSGTDVPCSWRLVSGKMPLELLGTEKCITDMSVVMKRKGASEVSLKLYADDTHYYTTSLVLNENKTEIVKLKLPSKSFLYFEFELLGSGSVEIYSIDFKYKIL